MAFTNQSVSQTQAFYGEVSRACPKTIYVSLHMVECAHSGHPAWADTSLVPVHKTPISTAPVSN